MQKTKGIFYCYGRDAQYRPTLLIDLKSLKALLKCKEI